MAAPSGGWFYIGYNKKVGANAQTVEAGDQVTMQYQTQDYGYTKSSLVAKLSEGAEAVVDGLLGPGLTLASDPVVAEHRLLHRVVARGIRLQEYSGAAGG